ncbi:hypothetical protein V6N13_135772, partial [Hibiscus sabdariffa]
METSMKEGGVAAQLQSVVGFSKILGYLQFSCASKVCSKLHTRVQVERPKTKRRNGGARAEAEAEAEGGIGTVMV